MIRDALILAEDRSWRKRERGSLMRPVCWQTRVMVWLALSLSAAAADLKVETGPQGNIALLRDALPGVDLAAVDELAATLRAAGFGVTPLTAAQVVDPAVLLPERFFLFVLPNAEFYPADGARADGVSPAPRAFARPGRSGVHPAGLAARRPLDRSGHDPGPGLPAAHAARPFRLRGPAGAGLIRATTRRRTPVSTCRTAARREPPRR